MFIRFLPDQKELREVDHAERKAVLAVSIVFPPAALVIPAGAMYLCQMITEKAFAQAIEVEKARDNTDDEEDSANDENNDDEVNEDE